MKKKYCFLIKGKNGKNIAYLDGEFKTKNAMMEYVKGLMKGVKLYRVNISLEIYECVDEKEVFIQEIR